MVHVRLNNRDVNPNPHVNFITPLKTEDPEVEEEARQLLRALAAQVRPIMKAEGFVVNSLEEYEHNQVFAGRNWNNGEVVELVLRGAGGGFLPTSWLLSTLCHELAHIKYMNHGAAFQALWAKLRRDVRELQSEGYYGDGYWSSGHRLADSSRVGGQGLDPVDLPEYMCGGAQTRTRPTALRRRRRQAGPSNRTGAQIAKKRKPGSRVTAKGLFKGTGRALNEDEQDEEQKKAGVGFRKQAGSKRAREERALAAERRILTLQGKVSSSTSAQDESNDDESDYEETPETDQDRRDAVLNSADRSELDGLKAWQRDYSSDFVFPPSASSSTSSTSQPKAPSSSRSRSSVKHASSKGTDLGTIELSYNDEDDAPPHGCDTQQLPTGGTAAASASGSLHKGKGKQKAPPSLPAGAGERVGLDAWLHGKDTPGTASSTKKQQTLSYGSIVQNEIKQRRKQMLGMDGPGKRLGSSESSSERRFLMDKRRTGTVASHGADGKPQPPRAGTDWTCEVCTLVNEPLNLACSACDTPRGGTVWAGNAV
ncbi:WLM-domain-containing protein [Fomes fomentarius]|nr:WLM-domain-containing protein [Fomes fomentarius]